MTVTWLEQLVPGDGAGGGSGSGGTDHPMRRVTRQVAFDGATAWTPERRARVTELFDTLADGWAGRDSPARRSVVEDALARGGPFGPFALDVGGGTGFYDELFARRFERCVVVDVAVEMLRRHPGRARVLADAATLPLPDGAVDVLVAVNALLFPHEVERVLARDGVLLWANTSGSATPIHLTPSEVIAALPGAWNATAAVTGPGMWCRVTRADPT